MQDPFSKFPKFFFFNAYCIIAAMIFKLTVNGIFKIRDVRHTLITNYAIKKCFKEKIPKNRRVAEQKSLCL